MRQLLAAAVVAIALVQAIPAQAQNTTTFVSGDGLDTNPCTLAMPCRSFAHAITQTNAGGQITMLDPAGYGAVTITKSISIVNDGGGEAGITVSSGDAITINAGASDVVTLRGLTVSDVAVAQHGINVTAVGTLNIQNCVIRAFGNFGVLFAPSTSAAITITDTIVSSSSSGIGIAPTTSGTVTASLERVTVIGSAVNGILFDPNGTSTIQGAIVDSAAIRNTTNGFDLSTGAAAATVALINSEAIGNGIGVTAGTGNIVMSRVTLAGNITHGFVSASLESFGDNYIIDTNNSPPGAPPTIPLQ